MLLTTIIMNTMKQSKIYERKMRNFVCIVWPTMFNYENLKLSVHLAITRKCQTYYHIVLGNYDDK